MTQRAVSGPVFINGGIYRTPLRSSPTTLDPAYVQNEYGVTVIKQIFDGLVRFDPYLSVLPALAETWQIKNGGKEYQFVLRENAWFHNLNPVTSDDVIFSITRLLRTEPAPAILPHLLKIVGAKEYRKKILEKVPGLKIKTNKIFTVNLNKAHAPFLTSLGMYQAAIVPKKEVLRLGNNFGKYPVGSGPFRFISWDKKKTIRLKQFKTYYAGSAFLDEIHFRIYPGGQDPKVLSDFQNGQLEEMAAYGEAKKKLAKTKELKWFHRPSLSLFFYGMNLSHPNLANPDLRKALSIAINRRKFVNKIYKGQFEIARTILPPGMPGYHPLNWIKDNNPNLAGQYLKQAFAKMPRDLPELEIVSAFKTPRVVQEMAMINKFWSGLGINIRVKYITDWNKFEAYLRSNEVQIYRYAWSADMPDPDSFLYSLFASESPTNFMNFKDKNIDLMLLNARGIVNPIERTKMYQKIEAIIMDSTPLIPLFYMGVDRAYQPYVKSVSVSALGAHTMPLNRIWFAPQTTK